MTRCRRIPIVLLIVGLVFFASAMRPAFADTRAITHGGVYFGSVEVAPDQEIDGDVTVIGGDADIKGTVTGNVDAPMGDVRVEPGGSIGGRVSSTHWSEWLPFAPASTIAHENARLMTRLAYSVLVVLAFLIFPIRVRKALDRIEHHPGLSAATGVLALVAIFPVALILLVSVVGWPLIPIEFIAIFAGLLIGQAALGLLLGRRIYELVIPHGTPTPLAALVIGLVVLSAAEILPAVGWLVTGLVCLVGLGAAILAFIRESSFGPPGMGFGGPAPAAGPAPGTAGPRPPIGGPPMTTG